MKQFEKIPSYPPELIGRLNSFIVTEFDDSMTTEMQMRVLIKWIIKNIDLTNEMIDYLNDFIKNFDAKLYTTLKDILIVWVNEGILSDLVREAINEEVVEARGTHPNLNARLNKMDNIDRQTTAQLAQNNSKLSKIVSVTQAPYHAKFDGSDETTILQSVIDDNVNGCVIVIDGEMTITKVVFPSTFVGEITGQGTLKALKNTQISRMVDLSNTNGIRFTINIDMSQSAATLPTDSRAEIGIYMKDAQNIILQKVHYLNCRIGRPFFIAGTSSNSPNAKWGSKHIIVENNKIFGIAYDVVDEGCYPVISSDFHSSTVGGEYLSGSNAVKTSDYTVDKSATFKATTKNITIKDLYAENCDRIAILNVDTINFYNCILENFYTRGYNFSPTCSNFNVVGGKVTGGDATQLAAAYGSKNGTFSNIQVYPKRPVGEKTSLKAYFGCEDIIFTNIIGVANYDRGLYTHSSKRITFDNVHLKPNPITVVRGIEVSASGFPYGKYIVEDIIIQNSHIEGNSVLELNSVVGNSHIMFGGLKIINTHIVSGEGSFLYEPSETQKPGVLFLMDNKFNISGNGTNREIPSKLIGLNRNNQGFLFKTLETITTTKLTIIHSFQDLFYYVPNGIDEQRKPNVELYLDGVPLVYGLDWFNDGSMFNEVMTNKIRLYDGEKVPVGSKLTLIRNS